MSAPSSAHRVHLGSQMAHAASLIALPAMLAAFLFLRPPGKPVSARALAEVKQRAITLASAVAGPARVIGVPQHLPNACWQVACQSGALRYEMLLDDTGRLWRLQTVGDMQTRTGTTAPLTTAAQARQVALRRLKDLRVLSPESRLHAADAPALSTAPRNGTERHPAAWHMAWWVRPSEMSPLYKIDVALDRDTGIPLSIVRDVGVHTGRRLEE